MPHDPLGWLALILKIALPFLSGGYLLTRILAHSVSLSGQRTSDDSDPIVTCRFALQNNEEVSITSREQLTIRILDQGGQFVDGSPVTVYAGWNNIKAGFSEDRKRWTMQFDELPAYDTWTIDCKMNREARNVEVMLQEAGAPLISSTFLSHDRLVLTSDRKSAFAGHRTKPEFWWAVFATVLALIAYLAAAFASDYPKLQSLDWIAEGIVVLFAGALYLATRRRSLSITQGYWRPTAPEPLTTVQGNSSGA